jgi:hypothetical protein
VGLMQTSNDMTTVHWHSRAPGQFFLFIRSFVLFIRSCYSTDLAAFTCSAGYLLFLPLCLHRYGRPRCLQ